MIYLAIIAAAIILARTLGPINRPVDQDAEYEAAHRSATHGDAK